MHEPTFHFAAFSDSCHTAIAISAADCHFRDTPPDFAFLADISPLFRRFRHFCRYDAFDAISLTQAMISRFSDYTCCAFFHLYFARFAMPFRAAAPYFRFIIICFAIGFHIAVISLLLISQRRFRCCHFDFMPRFHYCHMIAASSLTRQRRCRHIADADIAISLIAAFSLIAILIFIFAIDYCFMLCQPYDMIFHSAASHFRRLLRFAS